MAYSIAEAARNVLQSQLINGLQENLLYRGFGERFLQALSVLDNAIELVNRGDNVVAGGLFRFTSVLLMIEHLKESYHLWVGYGLGAHAQLMLKTHETILDFGLLPLLLSSFGIVAGLVLFGWLTVKLSGADSALAAYTVPFAAVCFVNSAGGLNTYSVVLVAAFLFDCIDRRRQPAKMQRQSPSPRCCTT